MHALILGSKEYPLGSADRTDPNPSGGMELYVQGLTGALARCGVSVTILTRRFPGNKATEAGLVNVVRVPFVSGFYLRNPTFNLMAFFKALGMDFDVIVSNGEIANLAGLVLSRLKRKPVIMVSHGLASAQPQYNIVLRKAFCMIDKLTYTKADAVITHAPWQMETITKTFHVVRPGFDRERMKVTKKPESMRKQYAPNKEKVIVYTGRLIAVKGVEYLIRSLKHVQGKHVCLIVGDGPDREKLEKLAKEENANVIFTGFRNDVANFLSIADVFVMPSLSESLNYSLVEAASAGVPIVCTDIGIISKSQALLVKKRDEAGMAGAINRALASKDVKMIKSARKYAKTFDWDRAAVEYRRIMESVAR